MDIIQERFSLAAERIREIAEEEETCKLPPHTNDAFVKLAGTWCKVFELYELSKKDPAVKVNDIDDFNERFLRGILIGNYDRNYENPAFAVKKLKRRFGRLLSAMAAKAYALMSYARNGNLEAVTLFAENFIEIYCLTKDAYEEFDVTSEAENAAFELAKGAYSSFMKDNLEFMVENDDDSISDIDLLKVNPQFVYDHRNDGAVYTDRAYLAKMAECIKNLEDKEKKEFDIYDRMSDNKCPTVSGSVPVEKGEIYRFTPAQKRLIEKYRPEHKGDV